MQRQRGELLPVGAALSDLNDGPLAAIYGASPQLIHHLIQVNQIEIAPEQVS